MRGIPATQFNLSVAGLPTIPDQPVPDAVMDAIRAAADQAGVTLAAISGTFNSAHPDPAHRRAYLARFPHLCAAAASLQIRLITLSSGVSRSAGHVALAPRQRHRRKRGLIPVPPSSPSPAIAEEHGLTLAVEPEHSNVVATADQASACSTRSAPLRLKIIYDAANLLDPESYDATSDRGDHPRHHVLGPHIALGHAKELSSPSAGRPRCGRAALAANRGQPARRLGSTARSSSTACRSRMCRPRSKHPRPADRSAAVMASVIRGDGARLAYELRPASATSRETFIFQHGMGGARTQPLGYLDPLPDTDSCA